MRLASIFFFFKMADDENSVDELSIFLFLNELYCQETSDDKASNMNIYKKISKTCHEVGSELQ